jgi:hypothetical protein
MPPSTLDLTDRDVLGKRREQIRCERGGEEEDRRTR